MANEQRQGELVHLFVFSFESEKSDHDMLRRGTVKSSGRPRSRYYRATGSEEYRYLLAEYVDAASAYTEATERHTRGPKVHVILIDELC